MARSGCRGRRTLVATFIEHFTYAGLFLVLFAAGMGVPVPEEVPIVAGGVLAHQDVVHWWIALPICVVGVLSGDVVLYWVGHHWGERILDWRLVRFVLTRKREESLKAGYRRHGVKIVFTARHIMGFRAAAFLTAGISRVPFWKFIAVDAGAAVIGVPVAFAIAFLFTDQLQEALADVHRVQRWLALAALVVSAGVFALAAWRSVRRA